MIEEMNNRNRDNSPTKNDGDSVSHLESRSVASV